MIIHGTAGILHFCTMWIINCSFIWIQLLFLIRSGWPRISTTQSQKWNAELTAACEWGAGAPPSKCREQLGERQAGAMMSPSLANKLGLTLWGPWRKGKGIEWECAVATLQDYIHGRWVTVVSGGGREASWNPSAGKMQMTPNDGLASPQKQNNIQMVEKKLFFVILQGW